MWEKNTQKYNHNTKYFNQITCWFLLHIVTQFQFGGGIIYDILNLQRQFNVIHLHKHQFTDNHAHNFYSNYQLPFNKIIYS